MTAMNCTAPRMECGRLNMLHPNTLLFAEKAAAPTKRELLYFNLKTFIPKLPASYQHAVAVVDLVLDDLRGEARIGLCFPLKAAVLIFHPDRFVPRSFSQCAEKRQTAFLGFIRRGL